MSEISVNGEWPSLEGETLQELIVQEFWCDGVLEDQANVVYLKVSGSWFRLYFDYAIVFWRHGNNGLLDEMADRGKEFGHPLINWGKENGVIGSVIKSCVPTLVTDGVCVEIELLGGKRFAVQSISDETRIRI